MQLFDAFFKLQDNAPRRKAKDLHPRTTRGPTGMPGTESVNFHGMLMMCKSQSIVEALNKKQTAPISTPPWGPHVSADPT